VLTEREWRLKKVAPRQTQQGGKQIIKAPMPGLVKGVLVAVGDEVQHGQRLVVLEAMKMENDITAPRPGRISEVYISQGATVEGGKPLVTLE
jgi:3-methylcrotonyl-CoA carboxylase alpha subunit